MMKKIKCLLPRSLFIVIVFYGILFLFPFSAVAQEGSYFEEQDELEANVNIEISWNKHDEQENSNLEESGSLSASISGNLVLMENRSGVVLFYPGEKGLNARVNYQNITTDKKTGEQYVTENGSGNIQILSPQMVTDTQKQGHMEWMGFSGPAGAAHALQLSGQADITGLMQAMTGKQKMDHYGFSFTAPIPAVITEKDGKSTEGSVVIHFGLIAEALKQGTNSNSVSWTSKEKEYGFFYQDFMGTKYDPPESGDVQYKVSWSFGEPPPGVEIQREVNGKWTDITDKTISVIVGEKIKLRAMVIPEDKDPGDGKWTLDGQGQTADGPGQNYIKRYDADFRTGGRVIPLENFNTKELEFYWVDGGTGEAQYTIHSNGEESSARADFEIQEPNYKVTITASQENNLGNPYLGEKLESNDCWGEGAHGSAKPDDWFLQYQGIHFKAENLDKGTIDGEEQWVQILEEESCFWKYDDDNIIRSLITKALDVCYPYPSGSRVMDAPAIMLGNSKEEPLQLKREDNVKIELRVAKKTQKNCMYLMFKPSLPESEWVPLKVVNWTWNGQADYSESEGWRDFTYLHTDGVIKPKEPVAIDTVQYPKWEKNAGDDSAYQMQ